MWKCNLELFNFYKYDAECWGFNLLTCGLLDRSFFSLNSDEDGWYLSFFWICDWKIRDTSIIYTSDDEN